MQLRSQTKQQQAANAVSMDPLDVLGRDITLCALRHLSVKDLLVCRGVCKAWRYTAEDERCWQEKTQVRMIGHFMLF